MSSSSSSSSGGMGLGGVLLIVFIVLKLCDVIGWSWWWVLSPLWIGFALGILIFSAFAVISNVADVRERRRRMKQILGD